MTNIFEDERRCRGAIIRITENMFMYIHVMMPSKHDRSCATILVAHLLKSILSLAGRQALGKARSRNWFWKKSTTTTHTTNEYVTNTSTSAMFAKRRSFYHSFDERLNSFVIDEDKILTTWNLSFVEEG